MAILSGDFLFVGDLGRPDLLEGAAGQEGAMEPSARRLFQSIQLLDGMKDYLQVWPGHGAGSACGKALGAIPTSTVGYEKRFNQALFFSDDEDRFVEEILSGS
jgi:hydroxyacylglutathione hydrolase